jgi:phosphatidylglycerophosphate synthase
MLDDRLRPVKERAYAPVARILARWVPAMAVTLSALAVTLGAALAAWKGAFLAAALLWVGGRVLDGIDGVVARIRGGGTPVGGYLDLVLDTVGYAAIPLALAAHHGSAAWWMAVAFLLASFYLNTVSWGYLSGLLAAEGGVGGAGSVVAEGSAAGEGSAGGEGNVGGEGFTAAPLPRGVVEGFETAVLYTLILALPGWSLGLVWIMTGLVVVTALERVLWGMRRLG